jgi:peptidoglycan-N-acetylglucosamine deacetylase
METSEKKGFQPCHRVKAVKQEQTIGGHEVSLWQVTTVLPAVDQEVNGLAQQLVKETVPHLNEGERLDVTIRHSRTGLRWMSFLVQSRVSLNGHLQYQSATSRTYDMISGEVISLKDLLGDSEEGWAVLSAAVKQQVNAYFPDETADPKAVDALCSKDGMCAVPFTLHGMSLVLHDQANTLYPERKTLMEVTVMYPLLRPYMTERAQAETDNAAYYKTCALTFDDGPHPQNTPKLLDNMMAEGARVTFMLIGENIVKQRDLVQLEHDEGHARGCHNWTHDNPGDLSADVLRSYPARCSAALIDAIGLPPKFNRAPYGNFAPMLEARVGWPLIQWSTDAYDWSGKPTPEVFAKILREIGDGRIILCHDSMPNTPESARQSVEYLQDHGYMFLTVDELFAKDGVVLQPDVVYYRCLNGSTDKPGD